MGEAEELACWDIQPLITSSALCTEDDDAILFATHTFGTDINSFSMVPFRKMVVSIQHQDNSTLQPCVQHQEKPKAELQTKLQRRIDVPLLTPWLAPIVWDGTFDEDILNELFRSRNITIGLTVFAIKKYVTFLKLFLETAEKYFMVGYKVNYYVFTDRPADIPKIPLQERRKVITLVVQHYARWQDISMHRMEMISNFSRQHFFQEVDYLICMDVDMKFSNHLGVEILSSLFGTLHPGFYGAQREAFTYERRPQSQAYIPRGKGDFYYAGGFFGGKVQQVYEMTKACHEAMLIDKSNNIEAVWHDESHLNKYLFLHKPTKVLSPEYLWDEQLLGRPAFLRKMRYVAVPKNHAEIRNK
ncbi:histo-blood group ABO system transferase [Dromiciops gliroides]|uniref:histo-blood group ABO system transferase n=1 Tax=Dromiciops gliroides TaxID=33562 RepID=UPI001CC6195D|nr:histo-blood group ABO system transferase [Dromiciops gliroides]